MVLRVLRGKNREKKMIWNPDQLYLIMDLNLRIFSVEKQPIVDGSRRKIVYDTLKKKVFESNRDRMFFSFAFRIKKVCNCS